MHYFVRCYREHLTSSYLRYIDPILPLTYLQYPLLLL